MWVAVEVAEDTAKAEDRVTVSMPWVIELEIEEKDKSEQKSVVGKFVVVVVVVVVDTTAET
jgi:hypothetical protein